MKIVHTLVISALVLFSSALFAQCEAVMKMCEGYYDTGYISDGQTYRALLDGDQVTEIELTLFGGNIYRFAACSGNSEGNLIFSVYDRDKNELFTNSQFSNAGYWDFVVESSMEVLVEARLDQNRSSSGCAILLIGFKE
jgi:hypothetical protein